MIAKEVKKINTRLELNSLKSEIYDFLIEYKLFPHETFTKGNYYYAVFFIDGFFNTEKGIKYYNDIIARFMLSFTDLSLYFNDKRVLNNNTKPYKLSYFQNLKSIPPIKTNWNFNKIENFYKDDKIFWALKAYFEYLIKNNMHTYFNLENYAISNFKDSAKDFSTLKAKCRSIWLWYSERDFKITDKTKYERKCNDKELIMTRSENMKRVKELQKNKTRLAIIGLMNELYANEYKLENGDWNKSKISRVLNIGLDTVRRHIKEMETMKEYEKYFS